MSDLVAAAVAHVEAGSPVLVCRNKRPIMSMHPHGALDGITDAREAELAFQRFTDVQLGIATGHVWDVLDVDVKRPKKARKALALLRDCGLLRGAVWGVSTPSGGAHFYFPARGDIGGPTGIGGVIDVRGKGLLVIAPPSVTEAGRYVRHERLRDDDGEPMPLEEIRERLAPPRPARPTYSGPPSRTADGLAAFLRREGLDLFFYALCRCAENHQDPQPIFRVAKGLGVSEEDCARAWHNAEHQLEKKRLSA